MTIKKSFRSQETIKSIINSLHKKKIMYAIARNYENFPDFRHDIDLFYDDNILKFIEILITTAIKFKWDIVTECQHWNTSKIKEHNITAFYFYKIKTNESLQIDLFSGFLILGIPIMNAGVILRERQLSLKNKFYSSNLELENIFRALQIHKLSSNSINESKIMRYKDCLISYENKYPKKISNRAKGLGLYFMQNAIDALIKNNTNKFCLFISLSKKIFLTHKLIVQPKKTFFTLLERIKEYYKLFISYPCGIVISISTHNTKQKKFVENALRKLVVYKVISSWSVVNKISRTSLTQKKILERGGVLIKFNNISEPADLVLTKNDDFYIIYNALFKIFIFRHKVIYENK